MLVVYKKEEWQLLGYVSKDHLKKDRDTKIVKNSSNTRDFYKGYPYIIQCRHDSKVGRLYQYQWNTFNEELTMWMKEHCKHGFRIDFHRTSPGSGITAAGVWDNRLDVFDELGGGDFLYAAFVDEQDSMWFALNWN
jgi:hypothetical protein